MDCKQIKADFLGKLLSDEQTRTARHAKRTFWPTDCLRPAVEIFWMWTGVEPTNPIAPETLLMFKAAKLYELAVIDHLVDCGYAADLNNKEEVKRLGLTLAKNEDEFGRKQIRLEMERGFCPWTGYLDGVMRSGVPIEVKSYYSPKVDKELARGVPPAIHYLHQLAVCMDFLEESSGILVSVNRSTGNIFFTELVHVGNQVYRTGDQSTSTVIAPPVNEDGEEPETIVSEEEATAADAAEKEALQNIEFDMGLEYARCRKIMEESIIPLRLPPLEYEYRPAITPELLAHYAPDKIKKAIKGVRVLSAHNWRPQYCRWKDLWIKTEMEQKGFTNVEKFLAYSEEEVALMMKFLNVEWKTDKNGNKKLFTIK